MKKLYSTFEGSKAISTPVREWNIVYEADTQIIASSDNNNVSNAVIVNKETMRDSRHGVFFDNKLSALIYRKYVISKQLSEVSKALHDVTRQIDMIKQPGSNGYDVDLYEGNFCVFTKRFDDLDIVSDYLKQASDSGRFTKAVICCYENNILVNTVVKQFEKKEN